MKGLNFVLKPFPSDSLPPHLEITGNISRVFNTLNLSYVLSGSLAELVIPVPADMPARRNALWKETCFEFFLALKGSDRYWEFNLSPAGHWNVFSFKSYRHGMKEEPSFTSLPFMVRRETEILRLSLKLDLAEIIPADQTLNVAISSVIKTQNGEMIHCALTHPGTRADFHRRDSFILELK